MPSQLNSYRRAFMDYVRLASDGDGVPVKPPLAPARGYRWLPYRPEPQPNPPRQRLGYGYVEWLIP